MNRIVLKAYGLARRMGMQAALAAIAIAVSATAADAALVISTGVTKNVKCTGGVCTATKSGAVLNATSLANMLASSGVKIVPGAVAMDITVAGSFTWASANALTLDAYRSITINQPLAVSGPGGLTMTTNDGGTSGALSFGPQGNVGFLGLTNALVINGAPYILVNSIKMLAADASANNNANYALANDYNAKVDGTYQGTPISYILGYVEGLGHTISNFAINDPNSNDGIALFAYAFSINDLHLTNINLQLGGPGSAAGLVTDVGGLYGDSVSGKILQKGATSNVAYGVAGMAGLSNGPIVNCSSSASVSAGAGEWAAGLVLVVQADIGMVENSHATGAVTVAAGTTSLTSFVGGLVAQTTAPIDNSYAAGKVTSGVSAHIGGLVGEDVGGAITNSHTTGAVIGATGTFAGGLVGEDFSGNITNSYATGAVTTSDNSLVGGVVGRTDPTVITGSYAAGAVTGGVNSLVGGVAGDLETSSGIASSWATGAVKGSDYSSVGGLVGYDEEAQKAAPYVQNSYAMGAASTGKNGYVGGLIGYMAAPDSISPPVQMSYSTGKVTGGASTDIGGLIGFAAANNGSLADAYWDTTTSGISNLNQGAGNYPNFPGIVGLTTTQFQPGLPAGFSSQIWGESANINGGLPYLLSLPPGGGEMREGNPGIGIPAKAGTLPALAETKPQPRAGTRASAPNADHDCCKSPTR